MNPMIITLLIGAVAGATAPVALADADTNGAAAKPAPEIYLLVEGQAFNFIGAGVNQMTVELNDAASAQLLAQTTTNPYGDFRLESNTPYTGKAVVTLRKPEHRTATFTVTLGASEFAPFIEASIEGALALRGQVTDERTGQPIAGAAVRGDTGYKDWKDETDTEGRFELTGLFPVPLTLRIKAEGYARAQRRLPPAQLAEAQQVALLPERILQLIVVDEADAPVVGVHVECLADSQGEQDYRQGVTDAKGQATIRGLASTTTTARVRLAHAAFVSDPDFDRPVTLEAGSVTTRARLIMQRAGSIAGTIRSRADREPLSGARVSVGEAFSDYAPRAWTTLDGQYEVTGVPPGTVTVTVQRSGSGPELARVEVRAGETTRLDLPLPPPRRVRGRVLDADGKPVQKAYLMITRWRDYQSIGLRSATDGNGYFVFTDAPADAFKVSVHASGFEPLVDTPITSGLEQVVLRLSPDRKHPGLDGTAVQEGEPAPDFEVKTLDGTIVRLSTLRGKVVLIDFWATWCGPCVGEIPHLREAWQTIRERDDAVMLSVSSEEDTPPFRTFLEAQRLQWRHAAGQANTANAFKAYGVRGIPAIFLIDREGKLVARSLRGSAIQASLRAALGTAGNGT